MPSLNSIWVVLQPNTDNAAVLARAAQLAQLHQAQVTLLECQYNSSLVADHIFDAKGLEMGRQAYLQSCRKRLDKLVEPYRQQGVAIEIEVLWDKQRHQAVLHRLQDVDADLVLLGLATRKGLSLPFVGHHEWNIILHCSHPVWVVKRAQWLEGAPVIAAVDPMNMNDKPGALDQQLVNTGDRVAQALGLPLQIIHVFDPVPVPMAFDMAGIDDQREFFAEKHLKQLASLMQDLGRDPQDAILAEGDASNVLVEQSEQANLLVMGAISRGVISNVVLGHTAERVMNDTAADILVIKPDVSST